MRKRFILLVSLILAGIIFGYVAARMNTPYRVVDGERKNAGMAWSPSPVWLPSYLLCAIPRNGIWLVHTRSGWMFRFGQDEIYYSIASCVVGGIGGLVIAIPAISLFRRR